MSEQPQTSSPETNTPSPFDPSSPATAAQRRILVEMGVDPNAANDVRVTKGTAAEWIRGLKDSKAAPQPRTEDPSKAPGFVTADKLPGAPAQAQHKPPVPVPVAEAPTEAEFHPVPAPMRGAGAEGVALAVHPPSQFLVEPEINVEDAIRLWDAYDKFRTHVLSNPACYDNIEGSKEMNRTGAMRLAMPFGLSIEQIEYEEGAVQSADTNEWDYRYRVRVRVGKGQRTVEGIGSCRLSEIPAETREKGKPGERDYRPGRPVPIGQREHFASTKAWTRATKRAIADILGGTEAE